MHKTSNCKIAIFQKLVTEVTSTAKVLFAYEKQKKHVMKSKGKYRELWERKTKLKNIYIYI